MERVFEIRFSGRSGSLYTLDDVSDRVGTRTTASIAVAARVFEEGEVEEARERLRAGLTSVVWTNMDRVAYVVAHGEDRDR